jgi:hypothetical protein
MIGQIALYFKNMTAQQSRQLRARLAEVAASHGYIAERGPTAGDGNPAELLVAIANGELATVLLADDERRRAIRQLQRLAEKWATSNDLDKAETAEVFAIIANALIASAERERR